MRIGGDFLGGAFFEKAAIQASEPGDVFGIMPETFKGKRKDGWKTVEKFGASKKFFEGVVHLTPFDGSHAYPIAKNKALLIKNTKRMEALANKYPLQIWIISPFCEHNHPRSVMEPLFNELRRYAPSCQFYNSIWKGQVVPGVMTEIHIEKSSGLRPEPSGEYVIAFDGFGGNGKGDFPDADIDKILAHYPRARHARYWNGRCNGKFSPAEKNAPPPNSRKHWPNVQYLKGHRDQLLAREGRTTYPNDKLYKPFADDHGEGGKDNKAMVIIPNGGENAADVFDSKGKRIDSMPRLKPDHSNDPKGRRYYSKKYATEVAAIARKNTGSNLITIKSGKVTLPPTDGRKRSGKFK